MTTNRRFDELMILMALKEGRCMPMRGGPENPTSRLCLSCKVISLLPLRLPVSITLAIAL